MLHRTQRARRKPGPLTLLAVVLTLCTAGLRAHDPGLSSLDVTVSASTITVTLSISSADVTQLMTSTGMDAQQSVHDVAHGVIAIALGEQPLSAGSERIEIGADGARVHVSYAIPSSTESRRLTVTSQLPSRLSRGHRELVVINAGDRVVAERIVDATNNSVTADLVFAQPSLLEKGWSFVTLGVRHILSGYDHLAFLAGLILAAVTIRELAIALTAFTAAHSISLALVVLGGVHISPSIVEPLIAASIAWIGVENLLRSRDHHRAHWWLVFAFGLIHGFGFAGGLMELGFGSTAGDIALALLSFNGGVEIGQLLVALALVPVVRAIQARPALGARLVPLCSSLIIVAGSYWLIERLW